MDHSKFSAEELERQYNPSNFSKKYGSEEVVELYMNVTKEESLKITDSIPSIQLSFGDTHPQKIDIFGESTLPSVSPILLFVHGGYWIFGIREESRWFVQPFHDVGVVCAALGYDIVDANKPDSITIPDIVLQVQKGICLLLKHAYERKSRGVYIIGHSAGAHLVSMALSLKKPDDANYDIIKGVFPISGIYDLHQLISTTFGPLARVTKEICDTCSPLFLISDLKKNLLPSTKVVIQVAEHDSECFRQHSEVYAQALKKDGVNSEYMLIKDEDHFTIILNLSDSNNVLTKYLIGFINQEQKHVLEGP